MIAAAAAAHAWGVCLLPRSYFCQTCACAYKHTHAYAHLCHETDTRPCELTDCDTADFNGDGHVDVLSSGTGLAINNGIPGTFSFATPIGGPDIGGQLESYTGGSDVGVQGLTQSMYSPICMHSMH